VRCGICSATGILAVALLCLPLGCSQADEIRIPENLDEVRLARITDNIYVVHGIHSLPDDHNKGLMSNTGIVLTDAGVVIVDAGGSLGAGRIIISRLRDLTDKPVIALFNTHVHGDHWLGNAAVREAFPNVRIYAHSRAIERLQAGEAETWLESFGGILGPETVGTKAVLPDQALEGGEDIEIGGMDFHTHHVGQGHTDTDIMIETPAQRLLFTGDVVVNHAVPSAGMLHDFSAQGQIKAVRYALGLPVDIYVPGHGATGGREVPEGTLRFLEALYASVKRYYDEGLKDYEMKDKVVADLAEYSDWEGFDRIGAVISFVYLQVEEADFQ
jgi:glyoxylase-like metal-dependent hydrolase (beta-lactamase superfamily II)